MSRPQIVQLSHAQQRILTELCRWTISNGAASVTDLATSLNMAGASSIVRTLKVMERNGFVRILGGGIQGKRRTVVLTPKGQDAIGIGGVPVLGSIPAGPLAEALEHCGETIDLGQALPHQPGDFLLVVSGHSMIGDGILSGDRVLLRPGVQVQNSEIAAVHWGDQYLATLKHICFEPSGKTVTLRASNEAYADVIIPGAELQIAGVFRGLIRAPARPL